MIDKTQTLLNERGNRYGRFDRHAMITQQLKNTMQSQPNWLVLHHDQKEALEMIAHKIGRILNGDPNYEDSWADIAGYAKLISNRLLKENEYAKEKTQLVGGSPLDINRNGGSVLNPDTRLPPLGHSGLAQSESNTDARVHTGVNSPKLLRSPFFQLAAFDGEALVDGYKLKTGAAASNVGMPLKDFRNIVDSQNLAHVWLRLDIKEYHWNSETGFNEGGPEC